MLSNKPEVSLFPIYVMFKDSKTIFDSSVYLEVKQSLETYDIALRRLYKNFEEKNMINNPLAELTESAIYSVAELEFFNDAVYDEATAIKEENERLKEENRNLREANYKLNLLNQSLKF